MFTNQGKVLFFLLGATQVGAKKRTFIWQALVRLVISLLFVPAFIAGIEGKDLKTKERLLFISLPFVVFTLFATNMIKSIKNYRRTYL